MKSRALPWSLARTCLLLATPLLGGCGGSDKPLVPVSGRATYGGGNWPLPGYVTLVPYESSGSLPSRPGSGRFEVDGRFVIGSYAPGDGLLPGKYRVRISCMKPGVFINSESELEYVPASFKPDDVIVQSGQDPIVLNYDVPKK
jgi:hypothetical protein